MEVKFCICDVLCHLFHKVAKRFNDLAGCLNQLDEDPVSRNGGGFVPLWVNESDVVPRSSGSDSTRCETNSFFLHPFYCTLKIVHP